MEKRERPLGVTILAILEAIGGIIYLAGILLINLFLGMMMGFMPEEIPEMEFFGGFLGMIALVVSIVLLILGLVSFLLAYGLWTGKGWAWTLTFIFSIIGILLGLVSLPAGIITILINIVILYYLTRPHVKAFFGKAPPPVPPPPPPV
ncbi:MAG: hypothetical protein QXP60_09790 [Nitrososphaerota archaeon]